MVENTVEVRTGDKVQKGISKQAKNQRGRKDTRTRRLQHNSWDGTIKNLAKG